METEGTSAPSEGAGAEPVIQVDEKEVPKISKEELRREPSTSENGRSDGGPEVRQLITNFLKDVGDKKRTIQLLNIPSFSRLGDAIYYDITITNEDLRWSLLKRFSEFYELNDFLEARALDADPTGSAVAELPPFPDKHWKVFTDHHDYNFIETRRYLLENYLEKLASHPKYGSSQILMEFLSPGLDDVLKQVDYLDQSLDSSLEEKREDFDSKEEVKESKEPTTTKSSDTTNGSLTKTSSVLITSSPVDETDGLTRFTAFTARPAVSQEVTNVTIPKTQVLKQDHVVYQLNVENQTKRRSFSSWTVLRRFVEFFILDRQIRDNLREKPEICKLIPQLPERQPKFIIDHLQTRFIEKRRILLQLYLQTLIKIPEIVCQDAVLQFLSCYDLS